MCVVDVLGFELDEASACCGGATSKDGGGGKSVACSIMDESSGAGTSEPNNASEYSWGPEENEQTVQRFILESQQ